jgi:putative hemolysin
VLRSLPPLIKGYLRLGGVIGEGAVVDRQFGTTDVFVLVATDKVAPRYLSRFDKAEQIQAAIGHG